MELCRRLVLALPTTILLISLFLQGHGAPSSEEPVAFLRPIPQAMVVRVAGDVKKPGVYRVPAGTTVKAVIIMAEPLLPDFDNSPELHAAGLKSGDIVTVESEDRQRIEISLKAMGAKEKMILGIPLYPDDMNLSDWDALPGIGPALAGTIVDNRQKYGDFDRLDGVLRVPGMGKSKIESIRMYFQ